MTPTDLLHWRRERRIGKRELATLLSVNRRTVWCWENAKSPMPRDIASRLLKALGRMVDAPICSTTHPRFYSRTKVGRKNAMAVLRNHPHETWRIEPLYNDLGAFTGYNAEFKIGGMDIRVADAVNLPAGTVLQRNDGQGWYEWVVP